MRIRIDWNNVSLVGSGSHARLHQGKRRMSETHLQALLVAPRLCILLQPTPGIVDDPRETLLVRLPENIWRKVEVDVVIATAPSEEGAKRI